MKTLEDGLAKTAKPRPIWVRTLLAREPAVRLTTLLKEGLRVPATVGRAVHVAFRQAGDIMEVPNTGWKTVRLRSSFGGVSVLLYEEHAGRRVSGLVRLKR